MLIVYNAKHIFAAVVSGEHKLGSDVDLLFLVNETPTLDKEFLMSFEHSVHEVLEKEGVQIVLSLKAVHSNKLIVYLNEPIYLK